MSLPVLAALTAMWAASSSAHSAAPLLIALHGYGASGSDLLGLAPLMPSVEFVTLQGYIDMGHGQHAWWRVKTPGKPDPADVDTAAAHVEQWLRDNITSERPVFLLGFSQGGVVGLQMHRRAPSRYSGLIVLSSFVASGSYASDAAQAALPAAQRVPVFWGRDPQDPVLQPEAVARTQQWLPAHTRLTEKHYPIRHSISGEEMQHVHAFIKEVLAAKASAKFQTSAESSGAASSSH